MTACDTYDTYHRFLHLYAEIAPPCKRVMPQGSTTICRLPRKGLKMHLSMNDWPMWPNMYGIAYSQGDEAREYRMKAQIADLKDRRPG